MKKYIFLSLIICKVINAYKAPYIPLFGTAKLGSAKLTHQLLTCKKVNPDQIDEYGNTPLHYAVHIQSHEVTNLLLEHHAQTNIQNKKGKTPLHIAVQQNNDYLVRRLMAYGANPNCADNNGNTPLHLAAIHSNRLLSYTIACDLLSYGADQTIKNRSGQTPLMLAQNFCTDTTNAQIIRKHQENAQRIICLLQNSKQRSRPYTTLDKMFIHIAKTTHVDTMKHLLHCPAINIDQQVGKHKRTALMYAAKNNRTKMVSYLIEEKHADKSLCDASGKTAYDYAKKHTNDQLHALLKT
ncbi:MAG: ankyrin repeat domain-containing protein [Candidatus Dependentiae bacterium]